MLHYVKFALGFLLIGTAFFYACKPSEMLPSNVLIGSKETVNLRTRTTIHADSIWDGRCPEEFNCLVAGSSGAQLVLTQNNVSVVVRLKDMPLYEANKGYIRQDSTVVDLQGQKVMIILRDVIPHRTASVVNPPNQKARVQISFQ